jgi:two-component system sensor histidine kinase LytS
VLAARDGVAQSRFAGTKEQRGRARGVVEFNPRIAQKQSVGDCACSEEIFESDIAARTRAKQDCVAYAGAFERECDRSAVDERAAEDGVRAALHRAVECLRSVGRREGDRFARDHGGGVRRRRVIEVEAGDALGVAFTAEQHPRATQTRAHRDSVAGLLRGHDGEGTGIERRDNRGRGAQDVDDRDGRMGQKCIIRGGRSEGEAEAFETSHWCEIRGPGRSCLGSPPCSVEGWAVIREDTTVLDLLVEALPHLRGGLRSESARLVAQLLFERLGLDAAAVSSTDAILGYIGAGSDHHLEGHANLTEVTRRTMRSGTPYTTSHRDEIGCPVADCPITAVTIAPFVVRGNVVGALKLYRAGREMTERDARVAVGIARVFSVYLEVAELDARAALVTQAELEALRAQISPHFLFNTLTTIAALTRIDPARAHDLIVDFADYFRESLAHRNELVTLDDELAGVERYVNLERARFPHLEIRIEADARSRTTLVPVLSVQPLVENAVTHGIAPRQGRGSVEVVARTHDAGIEVSVIDDGVGIPLETQGTVLERGYGTGLGIGLNNVNQRLAGTFGPASGLRIESDAQGGTTVRFWVPFALPAAV